MLRALSLCLAGYAVAALAVSPPPEGLGAGTTDRFEVLDLSVAKGFAVIKVVDHYEESFEGDGPYDCSYAGMSATPHAGVTLALWDLGAGRLAETFVVYAKAADETGCTPFEESQRQLAEAKAAAAGKGLDVARKPKAIRAAGDGSFTLAPGERSVVVTAETGTREAPDDDTTAVAFARLAVGGTALYEVEETYSLMGAGSLSLSFPEGHLDGGKVVFVLKRTESNMQSAASTSWALTPPLTPGG
jgi:hypothetical protein